MLVIAILNQKGGVGKITLSTNLAVSFAETHTVMFLDADARGSSQDWAESRGQRRGCPGCRSGPDTAQAVSL